MTNGVKRVFTAHYDSNHKLINVADDQEVKEEFKGIEKILYENKFFCNIENFPRVVPKETFIRNVLAQPYLSDFMRNETIMRCFTFEDLQVDPAFPLDSPLLVHILDKAGNPMLTCEFDDKFDVAFDPGVTEKLIDNPVIKDYVGIRKGVTVIRMSAAFKNSTLNDIAERVKKGTKLIQAEMNIENKELEKLDLDEYVWEFRKNGGPEEPISHTIDLEDITYKEGYDLVFYPDRKKTIAERNPPPIMTRTSDQFDSF